MLILTNYLQSAFADLGIDKSIFIKPKTFHLTVLMLKLWNKERVAIASDVLQVNTIQSKSFYFVYGSFW
jgi:AKAP7 2'5' RNA ligase-like domain